jgi:hypothetical protein
MTTIATTPAWTPSIQVESLGMSAGLMAMMVEGRAARGASAKNDIEVNSERLERLRAEVERAIEEAKEAQEDADFWGSISDFFGGDVAKVVQTAGMAAAVVASGGTALPFVVAALACSAAAEVGEAAGLDPKVRLGLAIAGAAFGFCAGGAGSGAISKMGAGLTIAGGAAQATGGAASIASGQYLADVERAQARERRAGAAQQQIQLELEKILDELRKLGQDAARAAKTTSSTLEESRAESEAVLHNLASDR